LCNKGRSAARICILDEHDPISGTSRIVSRGRSSLPVFLRRDRKSSLVESTLLISNYIS